VVTTQSYKSKNSSYDTTLILIENKNFLKDGQKIPLSDKKAQGTRPMKLKLKRRKKKPHYLFNTNLYRMIPPIFFDKTQFQSEFSWRTYYLL